MAQIINVDPEKKDDMFYRYKMPAIITKIEGSGNGIKTVFPNIRDICAKLNRSPEVMNKFFGYELGAQATFVKTDDKFLVMGSHTQERMQGLVYEFVTRLVLCKQCRSPETDPYVTKSKGERLMMTCRSCGKDTEIFNEKVLTVLLQTYKQAAEAAKKDAAKKPAADATKAKAAETEEQTATAAAAEPEVAPSKSSKPMKIETTAAQIHQENPITLLAASLHQQPPLPMDKIIQRTMDVKTSANLGDQFHLRLPYRAVVEGVAPAKFVGTLQQWLPLLKHFCNKEEHQTTLLKEVAKTCCDLKLPEKFPMALKMLWEEGVLSEAEIKKFVTSYSSKSKDMPQEFVKVIQQKSQPFLVWLTGEQ